MEIWGHRGAPNIAPENTLEGFHAAAGLGAYGVELDIQLTRDNQVVVIHDETVDRTSDGQGRVKDFTLREIKKCNLNKQSGKPFMEIPTLGEVFALLGPTGLKINVELKTGIVFYEGIERLALDIAAKCDIMNRIVFSSFNHLSVQTLKRLEPNADTALLCGGGIIMTGEECEKTGASALHCQIKHVRCPGLVEDCRALGVKVRAWTVDKEDEFRLALEKGLDGVFTNRIDVVKDVLRAI